MIFNFSAKWYQYSFQNCNNKQATVFQASGPESLFTRKTPA